MPDRCSIPECRAISNRLNGKLSMFRLPRDASLRAKWLKSMGKKDWNPGDKAVICERHFEPSCISKRADQDGQVDKNGRRLKSKITLGSLPTILIPPGTQALPVLEKVRRRKKVRNKKLMEGKRKRGRKKKTLGDLDSMPLQQRLTAIASTSTIHEQEKPIPTLKSQPLSPTKLKVTRQSTLKPQLTQPKVTEEVQKSVKEEICLKWNTHHTNMQTAFPALLNKEQYCDVTLVAEGISLKCHKLILSSCSSYFDEVLEKVNPYQHPIIFMKDIPFNIMKALCDFMYVGEVNIVQNDLDQILAVGESLKIKGLANKSGVDKSNNNNNHADTSEPQKVPMKSSRTSTKPSLPEKNVSVNDVDITDPLDLMEPTYEEAATPDIPPPVLKRNDQQTRKSTGRRVRKRKHIEDDHEPSPPVFRLRKGTRSRPNVKVPRYFNANFDNSVPASTQETSEFLETNQAEESFVDPYMNILEQIKTEPLDIEDSFITFEENTFNHEMSNIESEIEQYGTVHEIQETQKEIKLKKKTSKRKMKGELEKPDPLNIDHNLERHEEVGDTTVPESIEIQPQGINRRERLVDNYVTGECSDTYHMEIENGEREEMHLEKTDVENGHYEKIIDESANLVKNQLSNSDKETVGEEMERIETCIENNETDETQTENPIEEEEIAQNSTQNNCEIDMSQVEENHTEEMQISHNDFPGIRIECSYTDTIQEEKIEFNDENEIAVDNKEENNGQEKSNSHSVEKQNDVNDRTAENSHVDTSYIPDSETLMVAQTSAGKLDSSQDKPCTVRNIPTLEENSIDDVSLHLPERCNSSEVSSSTVKDS
ncbi:uncharacterized protein LOC123675206 isoform X2 [Harmonia axyridis]|uniref:uncharacterized protein LOC123675206 isoform X2 n=1 Tax=Harmonia axyridis TaxID=115357 RepID=UPI001E2766E1|nr:uncharacterized protein LOC123675206 isoform X2 [Harmonia axyridis]XP_045466480.1 uncharacterized protein LOC123675206 isoform X2 [Harmonia axyridis]XP_045466481.1 uncharacterized protein LOC123675206 isoform X2 [Harmonia axyridis]